MPPRLLLLAALTLAAGCAHNSAARAPGAGSVLLVEEVEIDAPVDLVWDVLTDLRGYAAWNPWLVDCSGAPEPGAEVVAQVMLNGRPRRAVHRVLEVEPPTRFCWRDHGPTTAFVYGQRCRELVALAGGGTRLRVELMLDGPMLRVAVRRFGQTLREGLAAETEALRSAAEGRAMAPFLVAP